MCRFNWMQEKELRYVTFDHLPYTLNWYSGHPNMVPPLIGERLTLIELWPDDEDGSEGWLLLDLKNLAPILEFRFGDKSQLRKILLSPNAKRLALGIVRKLRMKELYESYIVDIRHEWHRIGRSLKD